MKDYETQINPSKCKRCKACGLYLNQFPLVEKKVNADIFWVGLSAVQFDDDEQYRIPLSPSTRSGKLIQDIENTFGSGHTFLKTNLVKCVPLNEKKIRYPERQEMKKCFPNLTAELETHQPRVVFLLGRQVADFVYKQNGWKLGGLGSDFSYTGKELNGTLYVPIHHPSYILVYKRKNVQDYIEGVNRLLSSVLVTAETA